MKKFMIVFVALFAIAALSLASCKKCSNCKYTYTIGGISQTYTYPEACGKTADIDSYKTTCQQAASLAGGTCSCD